MCRESGRRDTLWRGGVVCVCVCVTVCEKGGGFAGRVPWQGALDVDPLWDAWCQRRGTGSS